MRKNSASVPITTRKPRQKLLTTEQIRSRFEDNLHQRYWAEKELVQVLPRLIKRITSYELAAAIKEHNSISEQQIIRLIHVFDSLQERATVSRSPQMDLLIQEANSIINGTDFGFAGDSAIISICQKIMLNEIDAYSSLREDALILKEEAAAGYLNAAIEEENAAHTTLSAIALSSIYFDQAG